MRGLIWLIVAAGVLVVLGIGALLGDRNEGETVSAGEWAQSVCGSVGVWRGQMEDIVDDIRDPAAVGNLGVEEPQSETPQGRRVFIRGGLELAVQATDTLIEGLKDAGIPETPQGEDVADEVTGWADSAGDDLDDAQESLDEEADSLEEAVDQVTEAAGALTAVLTSGVQTLADVARTDPELAAALRDSSTCEELREETAS